MQIENNVHDIQINIDRAKITRIVFDMYDGESLPRVAVQLDLISVGGNKISEVGLSTDSYSESTKMNRDFIPIEVYDHIAHIIKSLKPMCARKINSIDKFIA